MAVSAILFESLGWRAAGLPKRCTRERIHGRPKRVGGALVSTESVQGNFDTDQPSRICEGFRPQRTESRIQVRLAVDSAPGLSPCIVLRILFRNYGVDQHDSLEYRRRLDTIDCNAGVMGVVHMARCGRWVSGIGGSSSNCWSAASWEHICGVRLDSLFDNSVWIELCCR